jgi:hypothetical protein
VDFLAVAVAVEGCVSPPSIEHGSLFSPATDGRYHVHGQVAYTCQPGYTLYGHAVLTCARSGCWEPSVLPECRRDQPSSSQDTSKCLHFVFSASHNHNYSHLPPVSADSSFSLLPTSHFKNYRHLPSVSADSPFSLLPTSHFKN